jgi:multiple sugar transport system ATP-binding protein
VDTPDALFSRPVNIFVAGFIGSPEMNFALALIEGGRLRVGDIDLPLPSGKRLDRLAGSKVIVGIRPTDFQFPHEDAGAYAPVDIRVELVERLGSEVLVVFPVKTPTILADQFGRQARESSETLLAGHLSRQAPFTARLERNNNFEIGQSIRMGVRIEALYFFDCETGMAL